MTLHNITFPKRFDTYIVILGKTDGTEKKSQEITPKSNAPCKKS